MLITKDMGIMEIVQKYPATVEVLQRFGMGCIGCAAPTLRTLSRVPWPTALMCPG